MSSDIAATAAPLSDLQAPLAWPLSTSSDEELAQFGAYHDFHPAFVRLVTYLSMNEPGRWQDVMDARGASFDSRSVIRNFVIALWSGREGDLRSRVSDERLRAACDALCSLHARARDGVPVSSQEWREARRAVALSMGADELGNAAAEALAASGWDLDEVPAALADMFYPWLQVAFIEVDRRLEWNEEKQRASLARGDRIQAAGQASADALGPVPDEGEDPLGEERYAAYQKGIENFIATNPSSLDRRGDERTAAWLDVHQRGRELLAALMTG